MKKSPFVRIREKNLEIKSLKETILNISTILHCQPTQEDIATSISELSGQVSSLASLAEDNMFLRKNIQDIVNTKVEKETFNLNLDKVKLQDKIANLEKILDNKDNKIKNQGNVINGNRKGFWDFIYKIFNVN